MENQKGYTAAEIAAIRSITHQTMVAWLTKLGWHHDIDVTMNKKIEIWKKRQGQELQIWVFKSGFPISDVFLENTSYVGLVALVGGLKRNQLASRRRGLPPNSSSPSMREMKDRLLSSA